MSGFAIAIEYLTGYAVATDPSNREQPEWPPHPARVFMALAAAHFETEGDTAERLALQWLESLDQPAMNVPEGSERQAVTVYVPVNDATGLDVLPTKRSRQPRSFPRVHVGERVLRLIWAEVSNAQEHFDALEKLCRKVTRIGHSSSLVWARLERAINDRVATHLPDENSVDQRLRTVSSGTIERLETSFNGRAVLEYVQLNEQIQESGPKQKSQLKAALATRFPNGVPTSRRPLIPSTTGYVSVKKLREAAEQPVYFDPELIVLRQSEDDQQAFGLESTYLVMNALRDTIMQKSGVQPVPDWVSGHDGAAGPRLANGHAHMAVIPLPFVGHEHADGHLLGAAIVCPGQVAVRDRARVLSKLLFTENGEPAPVTLKLGTAGTCSLLRETRLSLPVALRSETWTTPSRTWASVTPIVLDRYPKTDRAEDRASWNAEVADIISKACVNTRLPAPVAVRVEKTPFFRGSLRAMPGQGGFPLMPFKNGSPRFQVHARIDFADPVRGPVLLGAGRFRGYGLCRPFVERGNE